MIQVSSIVTLTVVIIFLCSWYLFRKSKQKHLIKCNIHGPDAHWFWGNYHQISQRPLKQVPFGKWSKQYGKIYSWYIGTRPQIVVSDVELLSIIQVKQFENFYRRSYHQVKEELEINPERSLISESLSLQRWKQQRALLSPAFSSAKLKQSVCMIDEAINDLIDIIDGHVNSSPENDINIYESFQALTMDTIGRSAFGVEIKSQHNPNDPFLKGAKEVFDDRLYHPSMIPLAIAVLVPEVESFIYYIRKILYFFLKIFGYALAHNQTQVAMKIIKRRLNDKSLHRNDLLQQMIDAITESNELGVPRLSLDEAAANSFVFFEAGYETTSTLLANMTHVLVSYPLIQDTLRDEVLTELNESGEIGYNTLNLPYLDAVMNECLRLYPPITGFVSRMADADLKYKNITIPKGTAIGVSVYLIHRDPDYWVDPETFDPDRWLGDRKKNIIPAAFQPFGYGPRICIGMRFALLEAKMVIARLVSRYRFEPGPRSKLGDQLEYLHKPLSLTPQDGVFIKFVPLTK